MEFTRDGRPCKACFSYADMIRMAGKQQKAKQQQEKGDGGEQQNQQQIDNNQKNFSSQNGGGQPSTSSSINDQQKHRREDCPVDKDRLGRSTWDLLHTMTVYYPDQPTKQEKRAMSEMLNGLSKTYPCEHCAADFCEDLRTNPPALNSRDAFAQWMCQAHNRVNEKLGKPKFDCDRVMERWYDGWKDGSCD